MDLIFGYISTIFRNFCIHKPRFCFINYRHGLFESSELPGESGAFLDVRIRGYLLGRSIAPFCPNLPDQLFSRLILHSTKCDVAITRRGCLNYQSPWASPPPVSRDFSVSSPLLCHFRLHSRLHESSSLSSSDSSSFSLPSPSLYAAESVVIIFCRK